MGGTRGYTSRDYGREPVVNITLHVRVIPFGAYEFSQVLRFGGESREPVREEVIIAVQAAIRKGGHVAEYSVLALLIWRARRQPKKRDAQPWSWRDAVWAVGLAAAYAVTDELHQSFVPSRGASVWDVLLDTLGATAGIIALWIFGRRRQVW